MNRQEREAFLNETRNRKEEKRKGRRMKLTQERARKEVSETERKTSQT